MPETIATLEAGIPVEIGKIDRALKRLWQEDAGAVTRASLINFAVYCEGSETMNATTQLIAEITRSHACRAILIGVEPDAPEKRVQAWISAHCHLSRAGAKQVCCEQITFLLEGDSCGLIPNIVFSHLDSDLPLYLWWRGEFTIQKNDLLWTWVDRLIYDSQCWSQPREQLAALHHISELSPRTMFCDLNWTRSLALRQAFAQLFDHPENQALLGSVNSAVIQHAPDSRSTALLLAGWIAAQLRWRVVSREDNRITLTHTENRSDIELTFEAVEGPAVSCCALKAPDAEFRVGCQPGSNFLHSYVKLSDGSEHRHPFPRNDESLVGLLSDELAQGGKHQVYLKALAAAESLFG